MKQPQCCGPKNHSCAGVPARLKEWSETWYKSTRVAVAWEGVP